MVSRIGCAPEKNLHSENSMIAIDSIRIKKGFLEDNKCEMWLVPANLLIVMLVNVSNHASMDV